MLSLDDDLEEMLSEDEFAVSIIFKGRKFSGITNQEILETEYGTDEGDRERTVLYTRTRLVPDAQYGDAITVNNVSHYIHGIQGDGTGQTALIVHTESP